MSASATPKRLELTISAASLFATWQVREGNKSVDRIPNLQTKGVTVA
jgi:hypothetical protein